MIVGMRMSILVYTFSAIAATTKLRASPRIAAAD
jgi:hypothetical protein